MLNNIYSLILITQRERETEYLDHLPANETFKLLIVCLFWLRRPESFSPTVYGPICSFLENMVYKPTGFAVVSMDDFSIVSISYGSCIINLRITIHNLTLSHSCLSGWDSWKGSKWMGHKWVALHMFVEGRKFHEGKRVNGQRTLARWRIK